MPARFHPKVPSILWPTLRIVLLAYLGLMALIYFRQSALVFQPDVDRNIRASPADIGLTFAPLKLPTADGEILDGWYVPTQNKARGLVVLFHGNAGSIAQRLDYLRMFHDLGFATLMLDYRGYGLSSGSPSEEGTYLDATAIWRHATQALGFPAGRIVLFGESLGGGVATKLATEVRPAALVLASTFTSLPDVGADLYPLLPIRLLANIRYESMLRLKQIACPTMVIHSRNDDVIPVAHGRKLFDAANQPKQFLEIEGRHNDGFVFGREAWIRQLDGFLQRVLP